MNFHEVEWTNPITSKMESFAAIVKLSILDVRRCPGNASVVNGKILVTVCMMGMHSFLRKPFLLVEAIIWCKTVRRGAYWNNSIIRLLIVYAWPLHGVIKNGFLTFLLMNWFFEIDYDYGNYKWSHQKVT